MGTDIHAFVEVHDKETGEWMFWKEISEDCGRNYEWFSVICEGMRSLEHAEGHGIPARGWPEGISLQVQRETGDWTHDPSWISYKELPDLWIKYITIRDERSPDEDELKHAVYEAADRDWKGKWTEDHKNELPFFSLVSDTYWFGSRPENFMKLDDNRWFDDVRIVFSFDS
jgi:hypothetical protein